MIKLWGMVVMMMSKSVGMRVTMIMSVRMIVAMFV